MTRYKIVFMAGTEVIITAKTWDDLFDEIDRYHSRKVIKRIITLTE